MSRQHRRPRPGPPIPGSVRSRGRPEQPSERPTQQIEPRIETSSTTPATRQSPDARRRANSDKETHLTRGAAEVLKPKKKRPASWPSISEPRVVFIKPSKTIDQELSRVYDSVALPKAKTKDPGAVGGIEYNKLSYKGYPKKEVMSPSLDALPLSSMYSRLNTSNDPFQAPAVSKLSASTHSVPDIEEKREATPANKDTGPKETVQQEHALSEDDAILSPLYSNVNGNMHPVLSKQDKSTPPGPMYSVPDMKKKREARKLKREHSDQKLEVRQIPPQFESEVHTSAAAPLYSNVAEEMSKLQCQSYNVLDAEKMWERRQNTREISEERLITEGAQQGNDFSADPTSLPLYSNLMEEKISAPTAPIYSVPDMGKKKKERKAKNGTGSTKNLADQQMYPMKDLAQRERSLTSAPLYSNMDIEMSAARAQGMQDQSTPMYSVPDMNKKRQERLAQIKEGRQHVQRNASSPSLPPIPPQNLITDSIHMHHGQSTTFDVTSDLAEPMYPHVSVPSYLKKVKPMPADDATSDEAAHLYDSPRRNDIYKPLPLEGFYDVPSSKSHYDVPSSLSLTERSEAVDMQLGAGISYENERQNRGKIESQ